LGIEDITVISQVGDSVALVRSSEEDVYYRIDPMLLVGKYVLVETFCNKLDVGFLTSKVD